MWDDLELNLDGAILKGFSSSFLGKLQWMVEFLLKSLKLESREYLNAIFKLYFSLWWIFIKKLFVLFYWVFHYKFEEIKGHRGVATRRIFFSKTVGNWINFSVERRIFHPIPTLWLHTCQDMHLNQDNPLNPVKKQGFTTAMTAKSQNSTQSKNIKIRQISLMTSRTIKDRSSERLKF